MGAIIDTIFGGQERTIKLSCNESQPVSTQEVVASYAPLRIDSDRPLSIVAYLCDSCGELHGPIRSGDVVDNLPAGRGVIASRLIGFKNTIIAISTDSFSLNVQTRSPNFLITLNDGSSAPISADISVGLNYTVSNTDALAFAVASGQIHANVACDIESFLRSAVVGCLNSMDSLSLSTKLSFAPQSLNTEITERLRNALASNFGYFCFFNVFVEINAKVEKLSETFNMIVQRRHEKDLEMMKLARDVGACAAIAGRDVASATRGAIQATNEYLRSEAQQSRSLGYADPSSFILPPRRED